MHSSPPPPMPDAKTIQDDLAKARAQREAAETRFYAERGGGRRVNATRADLDKALQIESDLREKFARLSDPTKDLIARDATIPLLLFPLRLETRFKTVTEHGEQRRELWVRVYPDECLIDSFEDTLSED